MGPKTPRDPSKPRFATILDHFLTIFDRFLIDFCFSYCRFLVDFFCIQLPCGPSPPPCRLRSAFCVLCLEGANNRQPTTHNTRAVFLSLDSLKYNSPNADGTVAGMARRAVGYCKFLAFPVVPSPPAQNIANSLHFPWYQDRPHTRKYCKFLAFPMVSRGIHTRKYCKFLGFL